jgi:hypothetical protein
LFGQTDSYGCAVTVMTRSLKSGSGPGGQTAGRKTRPAAFMALL